jgi:hypothetical protein
MAFKLAGWDAHGPNKWGECHDVEAVRFNRCLSELAA